MNDEDDDRAKSIARRRKHLEESVHPADAALFKKKPPSEAPAHKPALANAA